MQHSTELKGEWMNEWSLYMGHVVAENYYDKKSGTWFCGASSPWQMIPYPACGIKIDADHRFHWIIYNSSGPEGCHVYSTEFIKGQLKADAHAITFSPEFYRKKYSNLCKPSMNFDKEAPATPFIMHYNHPTAKAGGF
ncbi:MAG: hypothetical protein ACLFOZ_19025 [Cyclobacteriaceae bacterium]